MKWQRYVLVGALVTGLLAGCGDDEVEGNSNENQAQNQNQNQEENQNQQEPDEFAEAVDVWIGAETNTAETATLVEVGESFGGRFDAQGEHNFALNLSAGDVLSLSVEDLESAAAGASPEDFQVTVYFPLLEGESGASIRRFWPQNHGEREIFITRSGDHVIQITAGGSENGGWAFRTGLGEVSAEATDVPGTQSGDLNDALIDAYSFTSDVDVTLNAEVFALRPPVESELDSALILWDADAGQVLAENDFISQENFDSAFTVDIVGGTNYVLVVDSWENALDAGYDLVTAHFASSLTNPIALDVGDSYEGTIIEAGSAYSDYFTIDVEPGEYRLVSVAGNSDLQPSMVVYDRDADEFNVEALPVGLEAAATLGVPASADEGKSYLIQLSDQRNLVDEPENLGGETYDYLIEVADVQPDVQQLELGATTLSLENVGDLVLFDIDLGDGVLLWMKAQHDNDLEDEELVPADTSFLPSWSLAQISTTEFSQVATSYYWGVSDTASLLLRDTFFRGGPDFETEVTLVAFDILGQEYGADIALDNDNGAFADATVLETPSLISGEFSTEQVEAIEEIPVHYFSVTLAAGEVLVMASENSADMESIFQVVDEEDEVVEGGNYLLEQFQVVSEDDSYWDRALIHEAEEDGDVVVSVQPYCYQDGTCETGDVTLRTFVEPVPEVVE